MVEGHYELVIDWKTQVFYRRPVILHRENLTLPTIPLPDRGDVRGRVLTGTRVGVVAFEEMWFSDSGRTKTTRFFTNENGEFRIEDLLPGKFFVGEGSRELCAVGQAGQDVKEIIVSSNQIARCDFMDTDRLILKTPYQHDGPDSNKRFRQTEQLLVGSNVSKQFLLTFPSKRLSHAELLASGKDTRQIRVTLVGGSEDCQIVHREFAREAQDEPLQMQEQPTRVFVLTDFRESTSEELFRSTKNTSFNSHDQWTTSFSQNRVEKLRIIHYHSRAMTSLLENGDYDITLHHRSGWAQLKCSVSGAGFIQLGPIEIQSGGNIDGRISLSDKQSYPTAIRITSQEGFVLELELLGKHNEYFEFSGLPPGKWKMELIDDTAPRVGEVVKMRAVELKATETVSVDL